MSAISSMQMIRTSFSGRWQVPIFAVGLFLFVAVMRRQIVNFAPVTFQEHLERVALLHEARELTRAGMYLKDLLKNPHRSAQERGELYRLYGKTAYLAESPLLEHQRQNVAAIVSNYKTAGELHATFSPQDWLAMGDAYRWSRQAPESIAAFRKALATGLPQTDRVRRQVIEMESGLAHCPEAAIRDDLDALLADESTSPPNYLWAMVQVLDRLLQGNAIDDAQALVDAAHKRLARTPQEPSLTYCEALVLRARGQGDNAEALLRSFRDQLTQRDEFWAKSGWLLGRIQQEDGRPQMAIAFYDDVLNTTSSSALRQLCDLGRAESLAALGRYDSALEAFRSIRQGSKTHEASADFDAKSLCMTLATIAESLRNDNRLQAAIDYLSLALEWTPDDAIAQRTRQMAAVADCYRSLASQFQKGAAPADADHAREMILRAADTRVAAAALERDEDRQITFLELAADDYDAAGRTSLVIRTLSELTARHARHAGRPAAMFRLAQAYRSQERYQQAISTYDEIMTLYPRLPDALRSMVPLADCLLHLGDSQQKRGVQILAGIVDGTGDQRVFTPKAAEYRQALFTLAEFLSRADDKAWPDHHERAISRIEDALALYSDAPETARLSFLLADAYRQSALSLRTDALKITDAASRERTETESRNRLSKAADAFERVIKLVADEDASSVSTLEDAYLRSSYLFRGDCYFELGQIQRALEAYREAAWRYENLPVALNACIQEYHCLQRLGRASEAQSSLGRLRWLLKKMPETAFDQRRGMSSKSYWQGLIDRLDQTSLN